PVYHEKYGEGVIERLIYSATAEVRFGDRTKYVGQASLRSKAPVRLFMVARAGKSATKHED
ncbi:MAG: hypothetical protein P8106_10420, partial [Gammaproteobacteria bacterium]